MTRAPPRIPRPYTETNGSQKVGNQTGHDGEEVRRRGREDDGEGHREVRQEDGGTRPQIRPRGGRGPTARGWYHIDPGKCLHPDIIGQPKQIGSTVVWLASPGASFTTGSVITVDGGKTAVLQTVNQRALGKL